MKRLFTPKTTKVIFFDMNNTLIDPHRSFDKCFVSVLVDFTGRWDPDAAEWDPQQVLATYRAEWNKKAKWLKKRQQSVREAKMQCLQQALKDYPFRVNEAFVNAFFREMRNQVRKHATMYPHVGETLAELAKSYKLGIISNGSKEHQEKVVRQLGLSDYIPGEHIFASAKGMSRKPNPAIFQNALKSMGIKPAQSVMVGDSWNNDIVGATKCGMNAVWICRQNAKKSTRRKVGKEKIAVVRGFKQLKELFAPMA